MKKFLLSFMVFVFAYSQIWAQEKKVSGKVTSIDDGSPLPGVNVIVKGTTNGSVTDIDGNYSIALPSEGGVLVFSFIGLATEEVEVGNRSVVDVSMSTDVKQLSEVVVTALGVERDKKALGYAVQEVESEALVNSGAPSAVDALVGKAAGVQITRSSGSVGAGSRILVRGVTSMVGNNQPLIVIDGVRTNNETNNTEANTAGTAQSNRLMDLNVEDIENISVLKGAAATALYGTAGATGVIVITTKKGTKGSGLSINVSSQVAFDRVTELFPLQSTFAQGSNGSYLDPVTGASGSWGPRLTDLEYATNADHPNAPDASAFIDGVYIYDRNGFLVPRGTGNGNLANNYEDDNIDGFFQTAVSLTNSVSISGGGEYASFRFSASDLTANGVIPNEEYDRKTFKLSSNLQATEKLNFSGTINYTRSDFIRVQQGSNTSGLLLGMLRTPASFDNANGFSTDDAVDNPASYIFPDGSQRNYRGGGGYDNPYWTVNNALRDEYVDRVFGSLQINYSVSNWLNFGLNVGTDFTSDIRKQNFEVNSRTAPAGRIIQDEWTTNLTDVYLNITGSGDVNEDFTFNYLAGLNMTSFNRHNMFTRGDNLIFQGFVDISNAATVIASEDNTRFRTLGFYGQVEGSWRNTIFLTASARQDYDSRLGVPNDFSVSDVGFFYPSVSTSIVFTEFMPNEVLSFGKFRASWAEVGAPPPFAYLTSTNFEVSSIGDGWADNINFPIAGVTGFDLDNTLGNPDLTPEFNRTIEFGLDLRFFEGLFGLDVAYYQTKTTDAILNASLPTSSGYSSIWLNSGEMDSEGIEITLNASPLKGRAISWDTQVNFTKNESIVEQLAPGLERLFLAGFNSAGTYLVAGNQYGAIFGGAYLREGDGGPTDDGLNIPAGAIVINNDPTSSEYGYEAVDPAQRAIGNPNPDFIVGWRNTLNYKNFSLGFLFDWRQGGDLWNGTAWALSFFGRSEITEQTRQEAPFVIPGVQDIQTDPGGDPIYVENDIQVARDQNYWQSSLGGFGAVGEQFVQDGGWIRLREASLFYQLPPKLLGVGFFKGGSIGVIGRNLWWDSEYEGIDPETSLTGTGNGQGFDYFNMPSTRSVMFKVSLNF
ncbi:MAG: SusC/RagA family TonB-linked outer membrane protein [Bacteroidota bacterium]